MELFRFDKSANTVTDGIDSIYFFESSKPTIFSHDGRGVGESKALPTEPLRSE